MKRNPAAVVAAGFLVISRGLGDFCVENLFSIVYVFRWFRTNFFDIFTVLFTVKNEKVM